MKSEQKIVYFFRNGKIYLLENYNGMEDFIRKSSKTALRLAKKYGISDGPIFFSSVQTAGSWVIADEDSSE